MDRLDKIILVLKELVNKVFFATTSGSLGEELKQMLDSIPSPNTAINFEEPCFVATCEGCNKEITDKDTWITYREDREIFIFHQACYDSQSKTEKQLNNLTDALVDDVINTTDEKILKEVEEEYGDKNHLANQFKEILEKAKNKVKCSKCKLNPCHPEILNFCKQHNYSHLQLITPPEHKEDIVEKAKDYIVDRAYRKNNHVLDNKSSYTPIDIERAEWNNEAISHLEARIEQIDTAYNDRISKYLELEVENQRLRDRIKELTKLNESQDWEIRTQNEALKVRIKELEGMDTLVDIRQEEITKLEAENYKLQAEIVDAHNEQCKLESIVQTQKQDGINFIVKYELLDREYHALKDEAESRIKELEGKGIDNAFWKERYDENSEITNDILKDRDKLLAENKRLTERIKELEVENKKLKEAIDILNRKG